VKKVLITAMTIAVFLTVGCQENNKQQNFSTRNTSRNSSISSFNVNSLRESANSILHRSLSSKTGIIRAHAIEAVSQVGYKEMMASVVKLLKDEKFGVRFTAAVTIGDMNYKPGALSVKPILKDENINARIAAAYTLTKMRKESLDSLIIEQLKNRNQTIRANAALLIGKLGKKNAHKHLKWVLNDIDSTYVVKIQATVALAMLDVDKKTTYKRLRALLVSKYDDDKLSGIEGLRYLNTEDSRNAIKTMLIDDLPIIKLFAAEQLGRMYDKSGKNEVINYFINTRHQLDSKLQVQTDRLAAMAIGRIGGPELEKHLPFLLKSADKDVQLRAAQSVLLLTK
jgi:HEAT repeat protein